MSILKDSICVAWVDISTGCFKSRQLLKETNSSKQKQVLTNFLRRIGFSEILVSNDIDIHIVEEEWHNLLKKQFL